MKEKLIVKRSRNELRKSETDWEAVKRLADEDIARAVAEDPDAAPLDIDWSKAEVVYPPKKQAVSIRLDDDILEYFRAQGPGYQTRINAVLRHYVEHQRQQED